MGSPNGGIIGVVNPTSFGKCTQTVATSGSTTLTTQPGTRLVNYAVVAGGGGGGGRDAGGGGAGGLRTGSSYPVCGNTGYPIVTAPKAVAPQTDNELNFLKPPAPPPPAPLPEVGPPEPPAPPPAITNVSINLVPG